MRGLSFSLRTAALAAVLAVLGFNSDVALAQCTSTQTQVLGPR